MNWKLTLTLRAFLFSFVPVCVALAVSFVAVNAVVKQRVKTLDASLTEALGAVAAKDHEIAAAELRVTKLVCSLNKAELARSIEVASHMALASVREEELSSLKKLVKARKLACPHICPVLDAASPFTELTRGTASQTEEHRREADRMDQLIQEYGPIKASLEYVKERKVN